MRDSDDPAGACTSLGSQASTEDSAEQEEATGKGGVEQGQGGHRRDGRVGHTLSRFSCHSGTIQGISLVALPVSGR